MGGWKHDSRKKATRLYEQAMGILMVVVLAAVLVEWAIGFIGKGIGN